MDSDERIIAMVALRASVPVDPEAVAQRVRAMFPWAAASVGTPSMAPDQADTCIIPFGEGIVPVIQVRFPVPREAIARAIGKSWLWPEAGPAFEAAGAHLIVSSLQASNDPRRKRDEAVRVTCVTAALAQLLPAAGIYWATADQVLPPEAFVDAAVEAGAESSPFDLWVATDFYPGPNFAGDKAIIARTNGLSVFIGREVECGPVAKQPGEIGPLVRGVGHYVLDRKVQFHGGETIGTDENPVGRIELGRTAVGVDSTAVYRVLLEEVVNG